MQKGKDYIKETHESNYRDRERRFFVARSETQGSSEKGREIREGTCMRVYKCSIIENEGGGVGGVGSGGVGGVGGVGGGDKTISSF